MPKKTFGAAVAWPVLNSDRLVIDPEEPLNLEMRNGKNRENLYPPLKKHTEERSIYPPETFGRTCHIVKFGKVSLLTTRISGSEKLQILA